jgi:signal transduction histidine kinase
MKISQFLLSIILIPILIAIAVSCYFQVTRYRAMDEFIHSSVERKYSYFTGNLKERLTEAQKLVSIISKHKEVIEYMTHLNVQVLTNDAVDYSKIANDEIYFTDTHHNIITGSSPQISVDTSVQFNDNCSSEQLQKIGNELKIVQCQKILNSENLLLGYTLLMIPLNERFFQEIATEYFVDIEFAHNGIQFSTIHNKRTNTNTDRHVIPYKIGDETINFTILTNNGSAQKTLYQTFIIILATTLLMGLALILLIPLLVKKYVTTPLSLIDKKITLFYQNIIVDDSKNIPTNEIKDIYFALHKLQLSTRDASETLEKDNLLLRVLSHDVSNTLTVIHATLVKLKRTESITIQKKNEILDKILTTVKLAGGVLHHVKEIKALETGKMELKLEATSINEIFEISYLIFEDRLIEKSITLTLQDLSNGKQFLSHKNSFINSVFNNFISNAIKFSPPGSEIIVKAYLDDNNYIVTITDQGIGIPEELGSQLFEIGKATSRKGTNGESGTGFGLTLAKTYMEHYNGKLSFSSQIEGKTGTTFELLLQKVG